MKHFSNHKIKGTDFKLKNNLKFKKIKKKYESIFYDLRNKLMTSSFFVNSTNYTC